MVNVGLGWSSIVGIALAASGLALYFLRSFRPKLARDHDIFFAAVALLCGGILFFQGWRQDPILQFGQFMLTASAVFFAVESVRLRGATTELAKEKRGPIVDDDRPVSKVYKAQLDDYDAFDGPRNTRRIRGRDDRPERDEYEENRRRPASPRASLNDRYGASDDRTRRRREDPFGSELPDEEMRRSRSRNVAPTRNDPPRSRRPRPEDEMPRSRERRPMNDDPAEYVDYRPIDPNETDNWGDE